MERAVAAEVAALGILGSTGSYAYLSAPERDRALRAAVEAAAGRAPVLAGIGALRTDAAVAHARAAEAAGADALFLSMQAYVPPTQDEAVAHYEAVAAATDRPLMIYDNPGAAGFAFADATLARLAALPTVAAIKAPAADDLDADLARLRGLMPGCAVGYSGDFLVARAARAGAEGFHSGIAGVLPAPFVRAFREGEEGALGPLLDLGRRHGGLRVAYAVAHALGLTDAQPPLPLRAAPRGEVEAALDGLA